MLLQSLDAEGGRRTQSSRVAWATQWVQDLPESHRDSKKKNEKIQGLVMVHLTCIMYWAPSPVQPINNYKSEI